MIVELSVVTHIPFGTLVELDDEVLMTYVDVVQEINRRVER